MTGLRGLLVLFPLATCACAAPSVVVPKTPTRAHVSAAARPPRFPSEGRYETRKITMTLGDELDDCDHTLITFDYDDAKVPASDSDELMALAVCLNSPKYRHLELQLVGRADPRGSARYNSKLGLRRAQAVKQKLVEYGVDPERMSVASRGEEDAPVATNVYSYGYDRRVDAVQLDVVHTP